MSSLRERGLRTLGSIGVAVTTSLALALAVRRAIDHGLTATLDDAANALALDALRDVHWIAPHALFLLPVVPLALLAGLASRAPLTSRGRALATALRATLAALLVLALARPVTRDDATLTATVVLVDVSPSVSDEALSRAEERVRALLRRRDEARATLGDRAPLVEVVSFAGSPRRVALPTREADFHLTRHDAPARPSPDTSDPTSDAASFDDDATATDLDAALRFAEALLPEGRLPRMWVLSDGRETRGRALATLASLAAHGVRVSTTSFDDAVASELAVTGLSFPDRIRAGQPFETHVTVRATRAVRARVRLFRDGRLLGLDGVREVDLHAGDNDVAFRTSARERGTIELRAEVEPIADASSDAPAGAPTTSLDRFAENNRFVRAAPVEGRPRVLLVGPETTRLEAFAHVLDAAELDVDLRASRGLPSTSGELASFDAVILADVPADQVPAEREDALERFVREGGVLLFAGGERSFGPGGWAGTRLERIMPVDLDGERRRDTPTLALALVLDRSGSMAGEKIELAKEAARATAEILSPDDALLVIGFDSVAERVVPLQSAANRMAIQRDIGRLTPRGGTAIFPALDAALSDLGTARAVTRHVILLTDGQTNEAGIPQLVSAMRAEGITVTSVGIGSDVNRSLLSEIADLGGGRAYFTSDPTSIPRIFLREASTVQQNAVVEELVGAEVVTPARFLRGIDVSSMPPLRGYVATGARAAPSTLVLRTELGDPLLATRSVGDGTTLAWTSDLQGRWSGSLFRWPLAPRFFGALLREHAPDDETSSLPLEAEVEDDTLVLRADAFDADDSFLHDVTVHARIEGPLDAPPETRIRQDVELTPIAPGRLEARVPLTRFGAFSVHAVHAIGGVPYGTSRASPLHPYPREYDDLSPDAALLAALAERTGGRVLGPDDDASVLFDHDDTERRDSHEELAPWLLGLALLVLVLDVAARRLARSE